MISETDISKLVVRQNIHKLKSQIKETEEYLGALQPTILLLADIDATAEQNMKNAEAIAEKKFKQKCSSSEKSEDWSSIVSALERAQERVRRAQDLYLQSQEKYNEYLAEYKIHDEALDKLKFVYQKTLMLYANLSHHYQSEEPEHTESSEEQQQAFLQTTFSI